MPVNPSTLGTFPTLISPFEAQRRAAVGLRAEELDRELLGALASQQVRRAFGETPIELSFKEELQREINDWLKDIK